MAPPIDRLYGLAADVLDLVVANWPGEAEPLPSVQFVGMGALDFCEAVSVFIERTFPIEADVRVEQLNVGNAAWNRAATIGVSVSRCVPQMTVTGDRANLPTAEELRASAELILLDAQAMFNVVLGGNLELAGCNGFAFESWVQIDPASTGMGGGTLRFRVGLQ